MNKEKIKKHLYCRFFHKKYRCYPDVNGKKLKGSWHCRKCHPCGKVFEELLKGTDGKVVKKKYDIDISMWSPKTQAMIRKTLDMGNNLTQKINKAKNE